MRENGGDSLMKVLWKMAVVLVAIIAVEQQ